MSISITEGLNFEPLLGYSPSTLSILLDLFIPALARDRAVGCLGSLPFVKIGRKVIYPKTAIQDWLNSNIQSGKSSTQPEGQRWPSLIEQVSLIYKCKVYRLKKLAQSIYAAFGNCI